jgi:hypothetical protein
MAITGHPGGNPDPALTDAVLFDVRLFLPIEPDTDATFEQGCIVIGALGVGRETVGKG